MYGVLMPFKNEAVYVSPLFKELLVKPGTNQVEIPESPNTQENNFEKIHFAYPTRTVHVEEQPPEIDLEAINRILGNIGRCGGDRRSN